MATKVSIITVNYNGLRYLKNFFDALIKQDFPSSEYEVVFVDNDSKDDSIKFVRENYVNRLNVKIIESKENLGFAGGNNLGVKNSDGEYIVLLNNDTAVTKDWLKNLLRTIEKDKKIGIATSKLVFFYDFVKISSKTSDKIVIKNTVHINDVEYKLENKFCHNVVSQDNKCMMFGNSHIYIPLLKGKADHVIKFTVETTSGGDTFIVDKNSYDAQKGEISINLQSDYLEKNIYVIDGVRGVHSELLLHQYKTTAYLARYSE